MDNSNNSSKVPFDPGWNDPPPLTYNAQQTTSTRPRNFLNKRVAFPLSGGTTASVAQLLPVDLTTVPSFPPILVNTGKETPSEAVKIDSDVPLSEVKDILLQFLENSTELGSKANDIKRRIGVMEEMWTNGKLCKQVHVLMKELAFALRDDEPSKADEIHRALMVDHVSAVGTWMPGVKQLIHHCIARSELLSLDKE